MSELRLFGSMVAMAGLTYEGAILYLIQGEPVGLLGILLFGSFFLCGLLIYAKRLRACLTANEQGSNASRL